MFILSLFRKATCRLRPNFVENLCGRSKQVLLYLTVIPQVFYVTKDGDFSLTKSTPIFQRFKKPVSSMYPSESYVNRVYGKTVGQPVRSTQRNTQLRQASVAAKHSPIKHTGG